MRTTLFSSCGQAPVAISQLKEAASSLMVCWMASSILIMLHPVMVLTTPNTCDELVYLPKLDGCTIDQDELPILSISVDCTSGLVVVNRTNFTHEALDGKAIVDLVLEYNATNITTGESEIFQVARNSLKLFGTKHVNLEDKFPHYEFKACVAFQQYPCWIFNEQDLSCTFDLETATSSSSASQSHTTTGTTTTTSTSSSSVVSVQGHSSSRISITSTTGLLLINTQLTTTPSSTSSSSNSPPPVPLRENDNVTAVIVPVTIVGFGVIVVLVVCFISISGRYFWSKNRGEHHTYIEAAESDTNLNSFPEISLDALSTIGSIATEYEGVRFELALMNGGEPPPMYAEKEDSNLLSSSPILMNKKNMQETEQNLYTNLNSNQVQCNSVISTRHPPLQTNVSNTNSNSTKTHIYRLNTISSCDDGYVGTLKSVGEDDGMLSEVASDLDQSVIMGYDENDQIFQENGSESAVASPTADHTSKPFPKQQIIEEHRQMEERLRIASFGGNTDGYLCDQETTMDTIMPAAKANEAPPYLRLPQEDELLGQNDSGPELNVADVDVNNKKLQHISVENTCSIHSQKQIMNTNGYIFTDNNEMADCPTTANQTFLSCVPPSITNPETTSTNIQANQPSSFAASDGYLSDTTTTMENTPHNHNTATATITSSDDYISNSPIDDATSIEHNDNTICTTDTPLPELDHFVIEMQQTLTADSILSIAPLQGGDGYVTEQGQDATISGLTRPNMENDSNRDSEVDTNGYISSCTVTNDQVITTGSSPIADTSINIPLIESMEEEKLVDPVQEPSDVSIQIPEKLTMTTQEVNDGYISEQEDSSITDHTIMYPTISTASTNTERNSSKANSSITTTLQSGGSHTNLVAPGIVDRVELMDSSGYMPYDVNRDTSLPTMITSSHQPPTPHDGYIMDSSSTNNSTPITSTDPQQSPFPFDGYISSDLSVSSPDSINPSPDIGNTRSSVFFTTSESPDRGYVSSSSGSTSLDTITTDHQTQQANTVLNNRFDDGYIPLSINTKCISTCSIQEPISEAPPINGSSVPPTIGPSPDYIQLPMSNQTNITKTNSGLDGYI